MINTIIAAKYNLNEQNDKGYTPIILAAYHGHSAVVKSLVDAGADACLQDNRGNTALMGAIFKGELKIARYLMSIDCHLNTSNNAGQTAAMYASLFQQHELLMELESKGANMSMKDINGNSVSNLLKGEIINP